MKNIIVPDKGEYVIVRNEPKENKFIKLTKDENRHLDNLEDLHSRNKLTDECAESVRDTIEKMYRLSIYMTLNNLNDK